MEVNQPDGTLAYQIQVFDQNQFQLLSTAVIPNAAGQAARFIRWGQSGLALLANAASSTQEGKLYLVDGTLVNPAGVADTTGGIEVTPVPTLTSLSPLAATVGSGGVTLSVEGRDFIGHPTVYWNGNPLATTVVNSSQLSAQVPAADLAAVGQAAITISNSGAALPASNAIPFSVNSAPPSGTQITVYSTGGNDLAWDAAAGKLYLSMPGVQGDAGDSIAIVDPVAGTVESTGFLGSDPGRLSLSDNGQYLYLGLDGENAMEQLTLPDFKVNARWNLGGATGLDGPYYALDLTAAPGAPQTTAVSLANFVLSPSAEAVMIYDGSTPRANPLPVTAYPFSGLAWSGSSAMLYSVDQEQPQDFLVLGVGASGAVLDQHYNGVLSPYAPSVHYDPGTGLIYSDGGQVIHPANGTVVGSYGASGLAVPDSALNRVFILGQTAAQSGTSNYTIESFDQRQFTALGAITIENVVGAPTALARWGSSGLAFTTQVGGQDWFAGTGPGQLYVVSGNFVNPAVAASRFSSPAPLLPVRKTWGRTNSSPRLQTRR